MRFLLIVAVVLVLFTVLKIYIYKSFLARSIFFKNAKWLAIAFLIVLGIGELSLFMIRDSNMSGIQYILFGSCIVVTFSLLLACIAGDIARLALGLYRIFSCKIKNMCALDSAKQENIQALQAQNSAYSQTLPKECTRRVALKTLYDSFIALLFGAFTFQNFYTALRIPPIRKVSINLANLQTPKTIAMVTDIHIGKALGGAFLRKIVEKINGLNADIVVIVGDLVDDKIENVKKDLESLQNLQSKEGVYYVAGNHEYYHGIESILAHLQTLNLTILHNTSIELEGFTLAGVSDLAGEHFGILQPDLESAKQNLNLQKPSILLSHQPKFVRKYDVSDFDLVLCGHTHAGQVFPLSVLVWLDQRYIHGLYTLPKNPEASIADSKIIESKKAQTLSAQNNTTTHKNTHNTESNALDSNNNSTQKITQLYVSSGAGFWGPAIRFLAPSEIVYIELC